MSELGEEPTDLDSKTGESFLSDQFKPDSWSYLISTGWTGYYQRCATCDWVGAAMRTLVDRCPACGGETDPDAALKAGGLLVWSEGKDFYLAIPRIPNSLRSIQPADVPDVIDLMEHWKYHKQNRHLFK